MPRRKPVDATQSQPQFSQFPPGASFFVTLALLHGDDTPGSRVQWIPLRAVVDSGSPFTVLPRWILDSARDARIRPRFDLHMQSVRGFDGTNIQLARLDNFIPYILALPLPPSPDGARAAFQTYDSFRQLQPRLTPGRMRLFCQPEGSDQTDAYVGTDFFENAARTTNVSLSLSWSRPAANFDPSPSPPLGFIQTN